MREIELGRVARDWLRTRSPESSVPCPELLVHQEVETSRGRADLVGRGRGYVVAVECKVNFGLPVIAQAQRWLDVVSESWICVPAPKRAVYGGEIRGIGRGLCANLGIGILEVAGGSVGHVQLPTRRNPKASAGFWDRYWHPDQAERAEAGTQGGHSTPWLRTAEALVRYVTEHPGVTLRDALKAIPENHYARLGSGISQTSTLLNYSGTRRPAAFAGIRIEGKGARATLWPVESEVF